MRGTGINVWQTLERATNIAILLACVALVTALFRGGPAAEAPALPPGPAVGDRLADVEGLELATHEQTLLLVLSSQCRFCTESMPFYRQLLDRRREEQTQVVVASTESAAVTSAYLAGHGVAADRVLEVGPGELGTSATPTLLEVSPAGDIREVIVGRVADDQVSGLVTRLLSRESKEPSEEVNRKLQ